MKKLLSYVLVGASILGSACGFSHNWPAAEVSKLKKTNWQPITTKEVSRTLEELVKEINPEIVAFGEAWMPLWVPSSPTAKKFARDILPVMKKNGFDDLVTPYINMDMADNHLADMFKDKDSPLIVDLSRFYADSLLEGCRKNNVQLHKGGYTPRPGYILNIEQYYTFGLKSVMAERNENFACILGEMRTNSVNKIKSLLPSRSQKIGGKKKVMWYGPLDFISLDEKALHASYTFFPKDKEIYESMHKYASFAQEFREEGYGKKFMSVYVIVPDFIPHDSLLIRPDLRMCWDMKRKDTAQVFWQKVEDCYNVIILYPFEEAESGGSLKDKVIRYDSDKKEGSEKSDPK